MKYSYVANDATEPEEQTMVRRKLSPLDEVVSRQDASTILRILTDRQRMVSESREKTDSRMRGTIDLRAASALASERAQVDALIAILTTALSREVSK